MSVDFNNYAGPIVTIIGILGGSLGFYVTIKGFQRTRRQDREAFIAAQKKALDDAINASTQQVENKIDAKFKDVEIVLKSRGELIDAVRKDLDDLSDVVNVIEKKLLVLDKAAELKLPEIDKIKDDINKLREKVYQLQYPNAKL